MRPSFHTFLSVGFALAIAVLALNTVISTRSLRRMGQNNREVLRIDEAIGHLESTLSTVKDAETGQRGFLLTGREEYLTPYRAAVSSLDAKLARLGALLDDPEQQRRLGALGARLGEKLDELEETVGLRQRDDAEAAIRVV